MSRTSEELAFNEGWRAHEKGKPREPNPFTGIDRDLALMWDAGWWAQSGDDQIMQKNLNEGGSPT